MGRILILCLLVLLTLLGCAGSPIPEDVGLRSDGSIPEAAAPPSSPNCVSSYVDPDMDEEHGAIPIDRGSSSPEEAQAKILVILNAEERTEILSDVSGYIHAVQYSSFWRFPDDIEFWFPDSEPVIHVRSAARLGKGDFGVNRKRVERIRKAYESVSDSGQK